MTATRNTTTAHLIAQAESGRDELGRTYGIELFHNPAQDIYSARFHIRTYDGVRVADSWATGEVSLQSPTDGAAWAEAKRRLADLRRALDPELPDVCSECGRPDPGHWCDSCGHQR